MSITQAEQSPLWHVENTTDLCVHTLALLFSGLAVGVGLFTTFLYVNKNIQTQVFLQVSRQTETTWADELMHVSAIQVLNCVSACLRSAGSSLKAAVCLSAAVPHLFHPPALLHLSHSDTLPLVRVKTSTHMSYQTPWLFIVNNDLDLLYNFVILIGLSKQPESVWGFPYFSSFIQQNFRHKHRPVRAAKWNQYYGILSSM